METECSTEQLERPEIPMSQPQNNDWVTNHWQQIIALVVAVAAFITVQISSTNNTEVNKSIVKQLEELKATTIATSMKSEENAKNNYKLYTQFTEFKTTYRQDNEKMEEKVDKILLNTNTLMIESKNLDYRFASKEDLKAYPLKVEIDSRLLKTAYRPTP